VFLNALPLNAVNYDAYTVLVRRCSFDLLIDEIRMFSKYYNITVKSYIRHPATLSILNDVLKEVNISLTPSSGLYEYREGDIIYVISLKQQKVERGKEVTELTKEDLEIYSVVIHKGIV